MTYNEHRIVQKTHAILLINREQAENVRGTENLIFLKKRWNPNWTWGLVCLSRFKSVSTLCSWEKILYENHATSLTKSSFAWIKRFLVICFSPLNEMLSGCLEYLIVPHVQYCFGLQIFKFVNRRLRKTSPKKTYRDPSWFFWPSSWFFFSLCSYFYFSERQKNFPSHGMSLNSKWKQFSADWDLKTRIYC